MRYRKLGDSDLNASEISLGSWLTYGVGVERTRASACVERAFERGINFFDTANVYGRGAAESFLGDVLGRRDRSSYLLATKLYFPMSRRDRGLSEAQVHKQIDASLRRLKTDYVDLYQCHRYDNRTPLAETSEWSAKQIRAALDLPGVERFVSSQPQYSMLWRIPEREVIPLCAANGIGQLVWSPLGQGVLTGKYEPGTSPPTDSRAASSKMGGFMERLTANETLEAVQRLKPIASDLGLSMAQLALAWVLREPNVASAIVGASRPEQVDDNAAASGIELDDSTLKAIDEVLEGAVQH
jgi:1-deoxyxylulose-5-phosphate synthase